MAYKRERSPHRDEYRHHPYARPLPPPPLHPDHRAPYDDYNKRTRRDEPSVDYGGPSQSRRPAQPPPATISSTLMPRDSDVRLLLEGSQASALIRAIDGIQSASQCQLTLIKQERITQERVLSMEGSDAAKVRAMAMIVDTFGDTAASADVAVKLLVHKLRIGAIIGRGGELVKSTQVESGAKISVTTEPLTGSSEKAITITGPAPAVVVKAFALIQEQLKTHPLREGTPYVLYTPGMAPVPISQGESRAYQGREARGAAAPGSHYPYMPPPPPGYFPPAHYGGPPPPFPYDPRAIHPMAPHESHSHGSREQTVSQKIAIPTVCSGCVLGKGGSIIKQLRAQSNTNISLADPSPDSPMERVVTISGTPHNIYHAIALIREAVERYQPQSEMRGSGASHHRSDA